MGQIVFQATLGGQVAVAGPNTASSFTLTLPAATDTLVGKATTDTLTNKTLTSPTITGGTSTATQNLANVTGTLAVGNGGTGVTTSTGTGNNVLSASPTLTGTIAGASLSLSSLTSGRVTYAGASGLLSDSANLQFTGTSLLVGSATATANFNFIASQSLDTTAGGMVENTSNTASATAVMRYKNSGSTFAYTGLGSPTRDSYAGLGANVLAMYTGDTAGISFTVDAAGPIKFVTSSTERMRITSAGLVGIGTSSPASKLHVAVVGGGVIARFEHTGETNNPYAYFKTNEAGNIASLGSFSSGSNSALGFLTADTERMRIDSSGNVGIGTSSPSYRLSVVNSAGVTCNLEKAGGASVQFTSSGATDAQLTGNGAGALVFYTGTSLAERMRLLASGDLLLGTTTSYGGEKFTLDFTGSAQRGMVVRNTTSTTQDSVAFVVNSTFVGWISASTTGTTYNTISDYRLKNITGAVTGAKDFIMALQPKQGTWKSDGSKFVGFVAHEFAEVSPTSVSRSKDEIDEKGNPVYQGIQASSSEVMANLISLVQEQQALIESLTTRLTALESK